LKIESKNAPRAIGPYSQAIRSGQFIFVSGQIPIDPASGDLVANNIQTQTHQVLKNIDAILSSAGTNYGHVVRTTIFLVNLEHFDAMNEIYKTYVLDPAPARSTVQVAGLPKGALIEIDLIAEISDG
tara:strand:- start:4534 stop:4914 length:381 start_codon:yes stop_codon:yes gene_type:complete